MATPLEQLDAMRGLAPNWDGYNADPPRPEVIDRAKELVSALAAHRSERSIQVYPARTGGSRSNGRTPELSTNWS